MKNFFSPIFSESQVLTPSQNDFVKETEAKVYRLLEETPPNGKKFAETVRHMLKREELWNNWKNEGCKGRKENTTMTFNFVHLNINQLNCHLVYRIQTTRAAHR